MQVPASPVGDVNNGEGCARDGKSLYLPLNFAV